MRVRLGVGMAIVVGLLGPAAGVASAADDCPNAGVREQQGSTWLPECRAFELVSPPVKNGNAVLGVWGARASGGGFGFWSPGAFAGAPSSVRRQLRRAAGVQTAGRRVPSTRPWTPTVSLRACSPRCVRWTSPTTSRAHWSRRPIPSIRTTGPGPRSPASPTSTASSPTDRRPWPPTATCSPTPRRPLAARTSAPRATSAGWCSAPASTHHPDVPASSTVEHVYEWSDGQAHLLSRDAERRPDGRWGDGRCPGRQRQRCLRALADGGLRGRVARGLHESAERDLGPGVRASEPQTRPCRPRRAGARCRTSSCRGRASTATHTPDTSKVLFSSPDSLTDDAVRGPSLSTDHTLYLYDVDADQLANVSPYDNPSAPPEEQAVGPAVRDAIGISDDGRRVYFVAGGRLVEPVDGVGPDQRRAQRLPLRRRDRCGELRRDRRGRRGRQPRRGGGRVPAASTCCCARFARSTVGRRTAS